MASRIGSASAAFLLVTSLVGCGPSDGYRLGRVRGEVTYQGKPITGGFITFMPDGDKKTVGPPAMSKIASDGTYTLSSKVADDGAVIGFHRVGIMGIDSEPIVEVDEADRTPEKIMIAKGQQGRRRPVAKQSAEETFTDRGGNVYRIITPVKLKNPETSGVAVEVESGSNTLNFHVKEDGTVEVES